MSSMPLPALDIRPPQQPPNMLEQYGQLQALKNQQVMQPLQQQAAQNQVQSSGLQLQQQQQDLKDQQGISKWFMGIDPKDPNAFDPVTVGKTLAQSGVSGKGIMAAQGQLMQHQQTVLAMTKDQLNNQQELSNNLYNGINGVIGVTDPQQRTQLLTPLIQQAVQAKALQPQQAQQMMQNPAAITDDQLKAMQHGLGVSAAFMASVARQQTANTEQSKVQASMNPQSSLYAPSAASVALGTAPGAAGIQAGEAQSAAQKAAAEAAATEASKIRVAQHSPMAIVMGNQLGGDQNSQALDFAADNYRKTGQMPPGLTRSPGSTIAIIQRAAQLDQQDGGQGIASNKSMIDANRTSLNSLQKNYDQVQAFEQTAEKNMDLLQSTAQKIPDLGSRFANVPVRMVNSQMIGTANMAAFKTALYTAQTEAAKVLNSSNATGILTDSARHELQDIIDGNVPLPAIVASLNTLKQDMSNRTQSYQAQIGDIQGRIKGVGTGANPTQPSSGPSGAKDPFAQFGGQAHQ